MANGRLTERNAKISEMLKDGDGLKNFYRFAAQNPHIPLHDACQIIIERPNATVCYSFSEWTAMDRRITKGRKGIAFYDIDGYKQFVFDANDTHGDNRYTRPILPMKRLLGGLDEINDTSLADSERSDYVKIYKGVESYLKEQDELSGDKVRDRLLIEGIAYSLYSKTGFPKSVGIKLTGLPYSYSENADLVKEVYIRADMLAQDIEEAYRERREEVKVIDDTEEETVSDEPVVTVEHTEQVVEESSAAEEQPKVTPYYQKYLDVQQLNPKAVVVMRLGDFYEVMGESAKVVSAELDLTLTGRNVGLPERVPMCGMPYHAMDQYLDKILKNHGVLLVDGEEEPKYILSYAEALGQSAETEEKAKPALTEITDNEPTPFDDEQSETDDWRSELVAELTDSDEQDEPVEAEEPDDSEQEELSGQESEKPKNKPKSTPKKPEQGIKDRKRKEKPQPTLFNFMDTQEQSAEEALIERQLKYGSGVEHGKFRIFDEYNENPSAKAFAEFLKDEYGTGGHGGWSGDDEIHNAKGITMSVRGEKGETIIQVSLKWPEVAVRIADLIDDDNYLSEQEKKKYVEYKVEQNRMREQRAEEERQKNELIGKVIVAAPDERKQRILDEYAKTTKLSDLAEFLKNEYGTTEETNAIYSATYNEMGVWIFKSGEENDYRKRIYLNWEEFADKVCNLIENDRYIEQPVPQGIEPPRNLDAEEDEDWDRLIDEEILKPVETTQQTDEHEFNRFKELSAEDKAYFESYANKYGREPKNSMWGKVQSCKTIANGIYEVSTAGHGGVMITAELAPHILSPEALKAGYRNGGYYNYEEDCDACIPLRELYDKGILNQTHEYFTHCYVKSDRPEAERGSVLFVKATDKEKTEYFKWWNDVINKSLAKWNKDYWKAYKQTELSIEQWKISGIIDGIIKAGTEKTTDGKWTVYFEDFKDDEQFVRDRRYIITRQLVLRKEVAEVGMDDNCIDTTYYLEYCPNFDWEADAAENGSDVESENTDLTGILDQSELGGAKTRFKGNVAAIKLVNKLYAEKRNPTEEEKKVLSQFVGWGGLSQAFDENNESWKKEYAELKGLLSQDDYEQARSSTLNAYYTSNDVITGIYSALNRFGVKGNNRILEPSMGTGNFFGFMPKEISDGARLYGVELDNLTGRIAAKLYPQANVQIKGFEETNFPNDKFDIVVGNVPFGGYGVADSAYNRYNFKVHDYFLAKSIDKVKPNGIIAIITSKGTMDKQNLSARKYVAERAELLGAIRLPNTVFKQTAGTEAVADILFFRKRTERINTDTENIEWLGTGKTAEGYEINNYFVKHPEMVLGTLAEEVGLYGGKDVTVKSDGRKLSEAIAEAVKNLPQGFYSNPAESPAEEEKEVDYNVKPMCFHADSGRLYMRVGDEMEEQRIPSFPKDAYQRIKAMIELREELHRVLDVQIKGCSDEVLQEEQRKLGGMYDLFVSRYGELNSQTNTRIFKEDGDSALLFACEDVDEETKKVSKAEVFYKRTIRPYIVPTSTDDPFEALQISKNERGRVDIAYIEELTGKSYDDVLFELGDAVFRDPEITDRTDRYSGFVTSEEYLSGRVVDKLNTARLYAEEFPEFKVNVEALEKVQPTPLTASEISVRLGQTWVDKDIYKEFYCELVGVNWWRRGDVELFYNPFDSSWRLDQKDSVRSETQMKQKEVYGTRRAPAYRLFIDCMNLKATTIYDTIVDPDGKERRVLNHPETIAAREKQNQIKEVFTNWIFAKPERREQLEETYNRLFNRIRLPSYDGSYLKFPEMNPAIELKPHQKNAVHRIISNNQSTLLHHVVGSGKTYTMVASIMKMRQLGICKKAMVAVPNHLVQQWASEWRKLYPNAKILVATKEDLEKDNRQKFVSKVAFGDWDGIIIAQSSFAKIPISQDRQIKKLQEEITLIEETVRKQWEESGMPRGAVKNLERIKKTKQAQLKKLMEGNGKDNVLTFENLGVDYLYVDEAHCFKNLFLFTKMNNVAGVSNAASQRASDLKLKCEYLQELHGSDRGIVFATGTPISNSMSEMYTIQSYLQPTELKASGISFFDGWAADFGETITGMELAPSGQGYKARTRFAKFTNLPELLTMYRSFADVQTADMVKLNVPEAERHVINLKPSDNVIELAEKIAERAEKIHSGSVTPEVDNMLKVTSDGKKLALDPRCFVPESEDEAGSKLNEAAQRIHEIWEKTAEIRGTQIVFCDLSTPKVKSEEYVYGLRFDAYNDLKYKLVQKGIPAHEIAFIHDANTDEQKQALFDKVNSGTIRVLIGSTEKCGAGTNVQKRLVALHHLDTPYRPSDMEQREGRIIRQGNANAKVDIYTYVTERTFDSYSYQILENKQKFISQIDRGDLTVREAEDIDETTLTYAEIKAITAANPKIKRKMEVDAEISRLRILEGQYKKHLYELQDKIRKDFPESIRQQELLMERVTLDLMHLNSSKLADPEAFEISVNGKVYTDRKEGGKALTDAFFVGTPNKVIAEYCGFKISVNPITSLTGEREITLTANGQYTIGISDSSSGNLTRLDNFIEDLPKRLERIEKRLLQMKDDLKIAEEEVEKPFEHKDRLLELLSEQTELNAELDLDKKEEVIIADENDTDDDNYKALPAQTNYKEDEIIDKEDKAALMQVAVLPDYSLSQENMHKYGYTWDGMLPLSRDMALRLRSLGLEVHKLFPNDTELTVENYGELNPHEMNLYGIEKPEWKAYIESEKGLSYLAARLQFAEAAGAVASGEMDSVDERFTGDFIETNYEERADLDDYLAGKPMPEAEAMKPYTSQLLEEFSERIWRVELQYYGWDEETLKHSIVNRIENEELKAEAKRITVIPLEMEGETMEQIDYEKEVIESVKAEFEEYKSNLLKKSPEDIFYDNYKIHVFTELKDVITEGIGNDEYNGYLDKEHYRALYEERGGILGGLYDDFIGDEFASVYSGTDTAEFIKSYCEHYHADVMYPVIYYGKDTENRAYYQFRRALSLDTLPDIIEQADTYTVAAPNSFMSKDDLEKKNIFFLKIGRDIQAEELIGQEAMENMMNAMDNYKRIYPLYLQTAKYANEHYEMIACRNSHKANEECKQALTEAIRDNFDGMHLNAGFEDKLIERYGMERVAFLVATTINEHDYDGRYSRENKEWAKTVPMSESEDERSSCCLNVHPAILDGFANRIREKMKEEEHKADNRSPEINDLMEFAESDGYKKTKAYYTFMYVRGPNGTGQYQVYMLDEGETEMYPIFEDVIKTETELERKWNELVKSGIFAPMELIKCEPQELLKMSNQNNQEKNKLAQDKYKNFTARGDKVLSIVKDRDDRNIAIIQRKNDFVVAARYDTTDGRWAQGTYDFKTLEAAEKFRTEKYGFENMSDTIEKKWLTCKVSPEALIKKYQVNTLFRMPKGSGYEGYVYSIFNDRIKEGTITTDLKSDTRERALILHIPTNKNVELRSGEKMIEMEPHGFISMVNGTAADKYEREQRYTVGFPPEAFIKEYENSMLLAMPNDTKYKDYVYYLPKSVISEDRYSDVGMLIANIGESFKVTLRKDEEKIELTAKEYVELVGDKKADKYKREASETGGREQGEDDKSWNTVAVSENAVIANYENSTLFKMPKGEYEGLVYYIPSGMVRKEDDGLYLRIPEDFEVHLKGGDEPKDLTAQEFLAAIEGKTDEDYENIYRKPSAEARKQFEKVEAQLRKNVPEEMLKKPNWVIVRTRENNETGRLDKFLIDAHTGKFAESDNPETWTNFDTACEYAKENGGVCLAYALDGKDGIACIDLDGCMEENGDFSEIAQRAFNTAKDSYAEKSVSGKGLHIFGKTKGADLRSFSKDKTMEYYQDTHFIAMTGDFYGSSELKSFDTPEMKGLLESKLEKRTEWKNTGMGVEGLSSMDDREMLDRAFGAKNGDTVKRLYNGEDLRHNHSNSDMSLMNYLAFWSNHDVDQMLRVFSTSGLYRPEKPQSYYEHTALKAIKSTPCYTPPKASNNKPSGNENGSGKDGK